MTRHPVTRLAAVLTATTATLGLAYSLARGESCAWVLIHDDDGELGAYETLPEALDAAEREARP